MHIDFLKSQTKETLTEFIEKTIYIYNFKHIQHKNTINHVSNDMHLVFLNVHIFVYKQGQSL